MPDRSCRVTLPARKHSGRRTPPGDKDGPVAGFRIGSLVFTASLAAIVAGCGGDGAELAALKSSVIDNYAAIVHASYEDSLAGARDLQAALHGFVDAPSEATLESAKAAWLAAREPYGQTEAYRFYGGPIDDADGPEPLINAWPLDEAYVDYVEGAPDSGIINDPESYPTITRDLLVSLNEVGAEENVSTGFHAIEFLLWGQDHSAEGPGTRPHTDYLEGESPHAARRAEYLRAAADLLVEHLEALVSAWVPGQAANYRAEFVASEPDAALQNILVGIGVLSKSELAGERMFTAYDNQDQEDEHSCFSDNTHRDTITNAVGIANVFEGRYLRTDGSVIEGPGLDDLLSLVDRELGAGLDLLMQESLEKIRRIPVPFDQAIVDPAARPVVLEAVFALQEQGDRIAEAGTRLGLTINTALPE